MTSVAYVLNGKLVSGTQKGGLVVWAGTSASAVKKQHTDAIWAIENGPKNSNTFFTGGNDGKIIVWNS